MQTGKLNAIIVLFALMIPFASAAENDTDIEWNTVIKSQFYGDRNIDESDEIIELKAPYRAEDAALVPIQILSKIPQTESRYIKTITVFIDKNPVPFSAEFHLTPKSGRADLAMRMRVNAYSNVRAVAELNDGTLSMQKVFVKASGGCSAPLGSDLEAAMKRMGKMKFRLDQGAESEKPTLAQLLISHPNITGLQMNQITRLYQPRHFIEEMKISFNGEQILTAKTDIAISADPNFRFYFVPKEPGVLKADIRDSNGNEFNQSYEVKL